MKRLHVQQKEKNGHRDAKKFVAADSRQAMDYAAREGK